MEVHEIFTVVIIHLLTMRHPQTLWEDESFFLSQNTKGQTVFERD